MVLCIPGGARFLPSTVSLGLSPFPVIVTTRIITFLVGDPELNLHLPLLLGRGTTRSIPQRPWRLYSCTGNGGSFLWHAVWAALEASFSNSLVGFWIFFGKSGLVMVGEVLWISLSMYMDVSKDNDTPKSSILIGFSIINHPFWGTTIFGNTHIQIIVC